jgi:16S rRNA processing protein RimM
MGSRPASTSSTTDGADRPAPDGPSAPLLDVGRVVKPHGLKGEVVVDLWTDRVERLEPGSELSTDDGPLIVTGSRPHQGRYLVFFEGVVDQSGAEALRGRVLRAPPTVVPGALWVHELMGAEVLTTSGRVLGRVEAVEANPASDLLVLEGGGLVPLRFVVEQQPGSRVVVDIPDGLLD